MHCAAHCHVVNPKVFGDLPHRICPRVVGFSHCLFSVRVLSFKLCNRQDEGTFLRFCNLPQFLLFFIILELFDEFIVPQQ